MSVVDYVVVPTSNIDYQSWQIRFLYWSKNKVKQEGKFLILNSADIEGRPFDKYEELGSDVLHYKLPNWAQEWVDENGEWWGGIPNKYNGLKWMTENIPLNDEDVLLFVDPDMIFLEPIDEVLNLNEVKGCRWVGGNGLKGWPDYANQGMIMYPFLIRFGDLKRIVDKYVEYCIRIRKETDQWVSEMWGLDYAIRDSGLDITPVDGLAHCTAWWDFANLTELPKMIHFPNVIEDEQGNTVWFKQDFTTQQHKRFDYLQAKNKIGQELVKQVGQYQSDYFYWLSMNTDNQFRHIDGSDGYIVFKPWPGGFNNIRMSFELTYAFAYLTNRTLVIPPTYSMYLLDGESNLADFFDLDDLGIKSISFEDFCKLKGVEPTWEAISEISSEVRFGERNETTDVIINMDWQKAHPQLKKWRREFNWDDIADNSAEVLYFESNLLGSTHQVLHTSRMVDLKKLLAKHIHYRNDIMDLAWDQIHKLGEYYAIHIRRNDFQYKELFIPCEEVANNISDIVPAGSRLYIATDHKDLSFFDPLKEKYDIHFYDDSTEVWDVNIIPIIEQLICSRAIKFIGMSHSTLSSYIYRIRGYMGDIRDKKYYLNTEPYNEEDQCTLEEDMNYIGTWFREYKDVWDFTEPTIFVSVASYRDSQIYATIQSCLNNAANPDQIVIGIALQETEEFKNKFMSWIPPNVRVKYTPYDAVRSVVSVRNEIIDELYRGEKFFLQVDSHTRFKENWDRILVDQYHSIPNDKLILTTYPNEFHYPDPNKEYLSLPHNAPLTFDRFFNKDDFRFKTGNKDSLKKFEVDSNPRVCAGFLFTDCRWLNEIRIPEGIAYNGEEDYLTYASYLKDWDLKVPSEAVVWHNYSCTDRDGVPYRVTNGKLGREGFVDRSNEVIKDLLFNQTHSRSIEQLEEYLGISLKEKIYEDIRSHS